jgi:hypothetical protein
MAPCDQSDYQAYSLSIYGVEGDMPFIERFNAAASGPANRSPMTGDFIGGCCRDERDELRTESESVRSKN